MKNGLRIIGVVILSFLCICFLAVCGGNGNGNGDGGNEVIDDLDVFISLDSSNLTRLINGLKPLPLVVVP